MKEKQKYFVCGGGHQGLAMAAYLALNGEKVTLWNRTLEHIEEVKKILDISKENNIPLKVIGNGTNLLVKDKGYRGII